MLGRPLIRLNMKGDIESSSVFGTVGARSGSTVWTDGPATEAVRHGGVLLVDEWDVTPPEIMFGFQYLLERGGKLYVAEMPGTSEDRMVTPHTDFRIVCCGNTVGQGDDTGHFAGTTPQNTATLDRFDTAINLGYLPKDHEIRILKNNVPSISKPTMEKMVQLASLVRDGYSNGRIGLTLSPRSLVGWAYKIEQYNGDVREAFKVSYADKLRESDRNVVFELYTKVFGK
jgi:cobaltochelatase CobS